MPSDDGVGLDDHDSCAPMPPRFGQHDPEQSVGRTKVRTLGRASQCIQLLPPRQVLKADSSFPGGAGSPWLGKARPRAVHPSPRR